jgi:hypothetical protein
MKTTVIELVTYRLKAGITDKQLTATHAGVNDFLQSQPGFIYRSLSRDNGGLLYDIVYWQNMDQAKAASVAFLESAAGQALESLIDEDSIVMRHMRAEVEILNEAGASQAA